MRLLRRNTVYGPHGKLPVGRTKFNDDYVYREGGAEFIPGTSIPRLRPVRLGPRAIAFAEDEVEAVIEALRRESLTREMGKFNASSGARRKIHDRTGARG
ncbi:putative ATP-dependent Lon-type protease [Nitrobacter vulgaris]|uniref:hypothetical protein n=1 Tax=Nitrobacter vulgaris TaxID=29421 RepID=UPI002856387E|nr:hypothetical protein [Nitrobacter vulgaris]MDR6306242.1 putative ATP-dependent Lon-type protease [Nitrobacter vulgaris]